MQPSSRSHNLSSDLFLVLTSLIIAFVIWIIAKSGDLSTVNLEVPLRLVNVPDHIEAELTREQVALTVTAPQSLVHQLMNVDSFVAEVDWNQLPDPRSWVTDPWEAKASPEIPLDASQIVLNPDMPVELRRRVVNRVQVGGTDPDAVVVKARFIARQARLEFRTTGEPAPGFALEGQIEPTSSRSIILIAPYEVFSELGASEPMDVLPVPTEPIDLEGRRESFTKTVRLLPPEGAELFYLEDSRIEARVRIRELIDTRRIEGVPIVFRPVSEGLVVDFEPRQAAVTLRGPKNLIDRATAGDLSVRPENSPQEQEGLETTTRLQVVFDPEGPLGGEDAPSLSVLKIEPEAILLRFEQKESGLIPWN